MARCQLFLRTFDFKVHGIGTPAGKADLQANDAIKYVDDKDVTDMTHDQVVQLIKNHRDLEMKIIVERYFYLIKVAVLHCYMVPTIYLQGEHSLICNHAEVSLQKKSKNCLLSCYSKIIRL